MLANSITYIRNNRNIWRDIRKLADENKQLFTGLHLVCHRHPNYEKFIRVPNCKEQFHKFFPNGGCTEKCQGRLECGHLCPWFCHPIEDHEKSGVIKCPKPCVRKCIAGLHQNCKLKCYQKCFSCTVLVDKNLPCGHSQGTVF